MQDRAPFQRLLTELRTGHPDATRAVFDRYVQQLVVFADSRLPALARSKLDPEDVAQSVFRTFFRRCREGEFAPDHWGALWALLTVLAARKCGHKIESLLAACRDVRRELPLPESSGESGEQMNGPSDLTPTPYEAAALADTLTQVLAGLKERERQIVLFRLQGHTLPEVAERVLCSERTVTRVLEMIRTRLGDLATA